MAVGKPDMAFTVQPPVVGEPQRVVYYFTPSCVEERRRSLRRALTSAVCSGAPPVLPQIEILGNWNTHFHLSQTCNGSDETSCTVADEWLETISVGTLTSDCPLDSLDTSTLPEQLMAASPCFEHGELDQPYYRQLLVSEETTQEI
eukprot:GHVS01008187.1.p1 GENE.GHVS01008187.1~~GHVS01008187.1.p1  ORF type:complete len:146 (-),score=19.41 GHVS01008187.1:169-606(-)